jgi:hypothetical protein
LNRSIQPLVNAQVTINRAVFEANKNKADEVYLIDCSAAAMRELGEAIAILMRSKKFTASLNAELRCKAEIAEEDSRAEHADQPA